jgi:ATP phosphoribosyltransferase regulatory subunit
VSKEAIARVLERFQPLWVEPPVLQPVRFYLEWLGEDLRARAFLTCDDAGQEACLRPDMTTPACRAALAMSPVPAAVAYAGRVFRRQNPGSARETEFVQVGVEQFAPVGEAALVAAALEAARVCDVEPCLRLGHTAVFDAFLADLALHPAWTHQLKAQAQRGASLSVEISGGAETALGAALAGLGPDEAGAALAALHEAAGVTQVGGRSMARVAARLKEKATLRAAPRPSPSDLAFLQDALAVDAEAEAALSALSGLVAKRPKARRDRAEAALAAVEALWRETKALIASPKARFAPGFGRALSFYDGFLFDLEAPALGERASLGGGGRYDGLIKALAKDMGVRGPETACGFALRPQRLAQAKGTKP